LHEDAVNDNVNFYTAKTANVPDELAISKQVILVSFRVHTIDIDTQKE